MAKTNWELISHDKNVDTSLGASWSQRRNWTVSRFRWVQDEDHSTITEEGDLASSLSFYNGSASATTISTPTGAIPGFVWSTTNSFLDAGTLMVPNGGLTYYPSYVPYQVKCKTAGCATVYWACLDNAGVGWDYIWVVANLPVNQAGSPPFAVSISDGILYSNNFRTSEYQIISTSASGLGPPPTITNNTGKFICTSDVQSFERKSVDWYKQIQIWQYKEFWG